MKPLLAALLVTAVVLLGAAAVGAAGVARHGPAGVVRHNGRTAPKAAARAPRAALTCDEASSCAAYVNGIDQYFSDVAAASGRTDNVYSVGTQYSDGSGAITYNSTFGGAYIDTTPYPSDGCIADISGNGSSPYTNCLTDAQLQTEIQNDITANGWPTGTSSLFFILTPSDVNVCFDSGGTECFSNYFCAYHDDFGGSGNSAIVYAVQPDNAATDGCTSGESPNNGTYPGTDDSINIISHEMNEAITDPTPELNGGWWSNDTNEDEMADLCVWGFGSPLGGSGGAAYNQVINGDHYWLQQEYSNADNGCVQRLGGTASPATTGSGPLVYQGGPVMHTNTVYAIYWFPGGPTLPANNSSPIVSGVAAVGKTLTTTNGGWSNSPTGYTYQWQQCTSSGTGCVNIGGATGATYQLAAGDAGHEIRSEVSAQNAGGTSAYSPSAPTPVVVPVPNNTAPPVVSGVAATGKTLSTTQGTWNTPVSYGYQWLRCSSSGTGCSAIPGATASSYQTTSADAGHELEARVAATNAAATTTATSATTSVIVGKPAAKAKPKVAGNAKVGKVLTASKGNWSSPPSSYKYQWLRCSARGTACVRIAGATKASHKLTSRDLNHRLRVQVTAVNAAGSSTTTSGASKIVS
ncbi:MAG TPA: hypothetical protein VKR79_01155 [Gaiellaceae bacterium]|nr:hypothetical protein [Gaiellaceae bacterium]